MLVTVMMKNSSLDFTTIELLLQGYLTESATATATASDWHEWKHCR